MRRSIIVVVVLMITTSVLLQSGQKPGYKTLCQQQQNSALALHTLASVVGSTRAGYLNAANNLALFDHPQGVAVDASGNLFMTDQHNNVIQIIQ